MKKFSINRGGTTKKIIESDHLDIIIKFNPHCCFIQIGGNDTHKINIRNIKDNYT